LVFTPSPANDSNAIPYTTFSFRVQDDGTTTSVLGVPGQDTSSPARTGNTTSGNATISNIGNTADLVVGMSVTGAGIPAGATILSKTANSITLTANATATATGVTLNFATILTINVAKVNDPPTSNNATATTAEDNTYTFNLGNFSFSDPNDVAPLNP